MENGADPREVVRLVGIGYGGAGIAFREGVRHFPVGTPQGLFRHDVQRRTVILNEPAQRVSVHLPAGEVFRTGAREFVGFIERDPGERGLHVRLLGVRQDHNPSLR